jgi:hypothetical protein
MKLMKILAEATIAGALGFTAFGLGASAPRPRRAALGADRRRVTGPRSAASDQP